GDSASSPEVTRCSSVPCRPQTPCGVGECERLSLESSDSTISSFGVLVHLGNYPIDYGPVLLRRPFRFHLTVDTLPSEVQQAVALGRSWLYPAFAFVPV